MTPLACCRLRNDSGFTLIEMVVALAVAGLMLGLVLPFASGWLYRLRQSARLQSVEDVLAGLPEKARRTGRTFELHSIGRDSTLSDAFPIELEAGWALTVETPIVFRYDGICTGGSLTLTFPGGETAYRLDPPFCRPQRR